MDYYVHSNSSYMLSAMLTEEKVRVNPPAGEAVYTPRENDWGRPYNSGAMLYSGDTPVLGRRRPKKYKAHLLKRVRTRLTMSENRE
eukprot:1187551-Prorocentrum_minimum.AAC.2